MGTRELVVALILLYGCGGSGVPPTAPSTEAPAPAAGAQVDLGASLYGAHCASCHGGDGGGTASAPALVGEGALPLHAPSGARRDVAFATAGDVYRWVRVAMPGDAPASLTDAEYAAILAFALQANGVDLGATTLDEARADRIRLH